MDLLAQMATFVRVVESGSLSAAARAQKLSLPAVSRQLSALEEDLGTPLILRTTRHLQVTEAGQAWYAHCTRILRDISEAKDSVSKGGSLGLLTVSAPFTIGMHCIVPRLASMSQRHPDLLIDLRLEDQVVDLIAEGVDVAIRAGVPIPDSPSFLAQPLLQFRRILVASPSYLAHRRELAQPRSLSGHDCLVQLTEDSALTTWRLYRKDEERAVVVSGRLRATAPVALYQLALDGAGVALLPEWLVQKDIAAKRLLHLLPEWESAPISVWALYRVELRSSLRVKAFVEGI